MLTSIPRCVPSVVFVLKQKTEFESLIFSLTYEYVIMALMVICMKPHRNSHQKNPCTCANNSLSGTLNFFTHDCIS